MTIRICFSALLLVSVCGPLAAQRRTDVWAVQVASADAPGWPADRELHLYSSGVQGQIRGTEARPRLGPAAGMVVGGVIGAALGVAWSRATCDPERCEGLTHFLAFCGGGIAGAVVGYTITGGKRLPGTRPHPYPPQPAR